MTKTTSASDHSRPELERQGPSPLSPTARSTERTYRFAQDDIAAVVDELRRTYPLPQRMPVVSRLIGMGHCAAHVGEAFQGALPLARLPGGAEHALAKSMPALCRYLERAFPVAPLPLDSVRVLLDLPAPTVLGSSATACIDPAEEDSQVMVEPTTAKKARDGVSLLLKVLGVDRVSVRVALKTRAPMGGGFGSSSADVIATLRAVLNALGIGPVPDALLAALVCVTEGAMNPQHLAGQGAVLFAQRRGLVVRRLGAWPPGLALGWAPPGGIDTLGFEPLRYKAGEIRRHAVLLEELKAGFNACDLGRIARVSSSIAKADDRLPHDHGWLQRFVDRNGAAGYSVSHSGVAQAVIWPAGELHRRQRARAARLIAEIGWPHWCWALGQRTGGAA